MAMEISAQHIRMHGNRVPNFTGSFKHMQEFKHICGPIQLRMKKIRGLMGLTGVVKHPL